MLTFIPSPSPIAMVHLYIVMKTPMQNLMKVKEYSAHKKDTYANVALLTIPRVETIQTSII